MGTRSLTTFIHPYEDKNGKQKQEKIVTMYRQYDGYPEGHGLQLAEFLVRGTMVNGIDYTNEDKLMFNGMGCLAAQVIAHFKNGAGGFYLHRGGAKDCWEEYRYEIINNGAGNELIFKCYHVSAKKWIFNGTPKGFIEKYNKVSV
jgi:hypothetical protein